jgi:radical SAM protein with 4Fe4S-binding SPASM domain
MLKRARPLVKTVISTNGTLLTAKLCDELVASGLDGIQFSLYAPDPEGYKFITQTDFPYDRVLSNLDMLLAARGSRPTPSIWLFIYDIQDFRARSADLVERYRGRIDEVYFRALYDTAGVTLHGLGDRLPQRYPCGMLWYSGAIRSNGDFLMCYPAQWLDRSHSVGNVHSDSLASYWRKLEEPRRLHLAGRWNEIPACRDCDVWKSTPSVFARRKDGTFYIPKNRWWLARVVNFLKEAGFKRPARIHRS